jgi:hypothetical protein
MRHPQSPRLNSGGMATLVGSSHFGLCDWLPGSLCSGLGVQLFMRGSIGYNVGTWEMFSKRSRTKVKPNHSRSEAFRIGE